jgi:YfiH family protein
MIHGWIEPDWPAPSRVRAFCTTRDGGVSDGPWSSLNLGLACGDDPAAVQTNREILGQALPAEPAWLEQVHGSAVVSLDETTAKRPTADAAVTFSDDRVCAVLTADCLPVLLCNRRGDRVAAAHAGWRGLAAGVLEATVESLDERPGELMAWMGPAIGPAVYEVGKEVVAAFPAEFPRGFERRGDRWLMDLYSLARIKLKSTGLTAVFGGRFCTFSESQRFYSYRRDGRRTGRQGSFIWID